MAFHQQLFNISATTKKNIIVENKNSTISNLVLFNIFCTAKTQSWKSWSPIGWKKLTSLGIVWRVSIQSTYLKPLEHHRNMAPRGFRGSIPRGWPMKKIPVRISEFCSKFCLLKFAELANIHNYYFIFFIPAYFFILFFISILLFAHLFIQDTLSIH